MKHRLACLTCLLALGSFLDAASAQMPAAFTASANGQIIFILPSQNIGCTYTPQGGTPVYKPADGGPELSCDRIKPQDVRVVLTPKSVRRFDKVGDQDCCGVDNVFAYGTRWSHGPFTCDSAETGLTCRRADGRGFVISRAEIRLQ